MGLRVQARSHMKPFRIPKCCTYWDRYWDMRGRLGAWGPRNYEQAASQELNTDL